MIAAIILLLLGEDHCSYSLTENSFRRFQKRELLNGVHRVHA
jgi:hypothetical protein